MISNIANSKYSAKICTEKCAEFGEWYKEYRKEHKPSMSGNNFCYKSVCLVCLIFSNNYRSSCDRLCLYCFCNYDQYIRVSLFLTSVWLFACYVTQVLECEDFSSRVARFMVIIDCIVKFLYFLVLVRNWQEVSKSCDFSTASNKNLCCKSKKTF